MNTRSSLAVELRDKEYRDAFVASQIRIGLPLQCRALRESRQLNQFQLAEAAGMTQPRISEIERPGERRLNIETLLRLASAYDVALQVRFVPFSQLVDDDDDLDIANFRVPPFEQDFAHQEKLEEQMKRVVVMGRALSAANPDIDQDDERKLEAAKPLIAERKEPKRKEEEKHGINRSLAG